MDHGGKPASSQGFGGLSRQDTAASHNSTGQGEFDFSDQLFNQLDNYVSVMLCCPMRRRAASDLDRSI